jgi:hypothetical protein
MLPGGWTCTDDTPQPFGGAPRTDLAFAVDTDRL